MCITGRPAAGPTTESRIKPNPVERELKQNMAYECCFRWKIFYHENWKTRRNVARVILLWLWHRNLIDQSNASMLVLNAEMGAVWTDVIMWRYHLLHFMQIMLFVRLILKWWLFWSKKIDIIDWSHMQQKQWNVLNQLNVRIFHITTQYASVNIVSYRIESVKTTST